MKTSLSPASSKCVPNFSDKPIYGVFISPNGEKYIGEFLNNNFHGKGALYDKFGNILFKGYWQYGEYVGKY